MMTDKIVGSRLGRRGEGLALSERFRVQTVRSCLLNELEKTSANSDIVAIINEMQLLANAIYEHH